MRRRGPRPVAFSLDALADRLEPPTLLAAVQRVWPAAAGSFAAVAEPVAERDGVVTVACDSAVLSSELDLMSELVVDRVNEELGRPAVKRLRTRATRT
ncbi:MAG TPA: DciA family protein [Solirubrobacter sp.]